MLLEGQLAILERLTLMESSQELMFEGQLAVLERLLLTEVRQELAVRGSAGCFREANSG